MGIMARVFLWKQAAINWIVGLVVSWTLAHSICQGIWHILLSLFWHSTWWFRMFMGNIMYIMNPYQKNGTKFSNCSFSHMWSISWRLGCSFSLVSKKVIITPTGCGNHVVEQEEGCDCGDLWRKDLFCQSNCTLKPEAVCALGLCCKHWPLYQQAAFVEKRKMHVISQSGAMGHPMIVQKMCMCTLSSHERPVLEASAMKRNALSMMNNVRTFLARRPGEQIGVATEKWTP